MDDALRLAAEAKRTEEYPRGRIEHPGHTLSRVIEPPKTPFFLGVFGPRGSGKSVLLQDLVKKYAPRVLWYDILHEIDAGAIARSRVGLWAQAIRLRYSEEARIVYRPRKVNHYEEFDYVCGAAMKYAKDGVIAVDEIDRAASKVLPEESDVREFVDLGRHDNLALWVATRRPVAASTYILAEIRHWYVARMHLPRDLHFFREMVGKDAMDRIMSLDRYEFLHVDVDTNAQEIVKKTLTSDRAESTVST